MESKYLPRDVHMIILAHMPVKSLLRFKSVCKSWRRIIEDRGFIDTHRLTRATTSKRNCALVIRNHEQVCSLHGSDQARAFKCVALDLPVVNNKNKMQIGIALVCNGILCMSDGQRDTVLWNPAIRDYKALPTSSTQPLGLDLDLTPPDEYLDLRVFCIGFGFDPNTEDYKVVRIWTVLHRPDIMKAEVYSLNADSWRSINIHIPMSNRMELAPGQVYLNGKYYWFFEHDLIHYKILCFDMVKEVFEVINMPDSHSENGSWDRLVVMDSEDNEVSEVIELPEGLCDNGSWYKLIGMKDSLVMVSYTCPVNGKCFFHIWVMNEDGGSRSWHKFLTIGPFFENDAPLGFWKNDELLIKIQYTAIISYDNTTQEIKDYIDWMDLDEFLPIVIYDESLVSVNHGRFQEEKETRN